MKEDCGFMLCVVYCCEVVSYTALLCVFLFSLLRLNLLLNQRLVFITKQCLH